MSSIPVIWYEGIAGLYASEGTHGRSRYACCGLLNDALDSIGNCEHFSGWHDVEGAIVVIHGGHLRGQVNEINANIAKLRWALLIGIGDEENDFPYSSLSHPNMKLWMQSPIPSRFCGNRQIIVGYPCDCRELLVHGQDRIYEWSFMGQITHVRRRECVEILRKMPNGRLVETQQFYSGLGHEEYFKILGQTKVVPCVSGPVCSDTFRLAEALEAGCVPVADEHPGWKDATPGIWNMLTPGHPFPIVKNWSEFPAVLQNILADYDNIQKKCIDFWAEYKLQYFNDLKEDLKQLGANCV